MYQYCIKQDTNIIYLVLKDYKLFLLHVWLHFHDLQKEMESVYKPRRTILTDQPVGVLLIVIALCYCRKSLADSGIPKRIPVDRVDHNRSKIPQIACIPWAIQIGCMVRQFVGCLLGEPTIQTIRVIKRQTTSSLEAEPIWICQIVYLAVEEIVVLFLWHHLAH